MHLFTSILSLFCSFATEETNGVSEDDILDDESTSDEEEEPSFIDKQTTRTKVLFALMLIIPILLLVIVDVLSGPDLRRENIRLTSYFDTVIAVTLYVDEDTPESDIDLISSDTEQLIKDIHQQADRYNTYPGVVNTATINNDPTKTHQVDDHLFNILKLSKEYHELTNGYFDITMGPVLDLWSDKMDACIEENICETPTNVSLYFASQKVGIDGLTLNESTQEVSMEEGMNLNLGGVAKGYATNRLTELLKTYEVIDSFLISAGSSNIEVHGQHPVRDSELWEIGVTDPSNPLDQRGFVGVQIPSGTSLVTSGDYVRYYTVDDKRYHHLISPFTLEPTYHHRSVTVVIEDGSIGDIISTAAFLMEPSESQTFINNLEDVEAVWYMPDDSVVTSDNFEDYLLEWRN